jgi:ABC-type polysaccharide/polyol phosphate export permease
MSLMQSVLFVAAFYLMFTIIGARTMAIRGDFMLYLLSGIFMYLVHIQALQAVMGSENSTSPMMQHAPMNTLVAILSSAISVLYIKTISLLVILFVLHTLFQPIEMYDWSGAMMMYLLAWGSGCAIGLILMAFKPWAPDVVTIIQLVYVRANMIASGKMFVANTLPGFMLAMFDWNPLFHIIDQTRGFVFVNYVPHYSNWQYPLYATLGLIMIGMMGNSSRASAHRCQLGCAPLGGVSHHPKRQVDPPAPAAASSCPRGCGRSRGRPAAPHPTAPRHRRISARPIASCHREWCRRPGTAPRRRARSTRRAW